MRAHLAAARDRLAAELALLRLLLGEPRVPRLSKWLLAAALGYHKREAKPGWWRHLPP